MSALAFSSSGIARVYKRDALFRTFRDKEGFAVFIIGPDSLGGRGFLNDKAHPTNQSDPGRSQSIKF